jgi:hypothetical protein
MHRMTRLARLRLVVPLLRSRHPPAYSAGGTAVGLAWAFTPTPGIQMLLVFITWLAARRLFQTHFSLVLGLAWTWVSNVFTTPPALYLSYVTGQLLLGRWHDISGYRSFLALWDGAFASDLPLYRQVLTALQMAIRDWGLAIWIGCLPWSALFAWLGYRWSLKFVEAHRHAREQRFVKRQRPPA